MSVNRHRKGPRPKLQRYFLNWLEVNHARLAIPLTLESRTDRQVTLNFEGITRALEITLTHEIGVHAMKNAEWWDALLFFEAWPVKTDQGYICRWCKPEYIRPYPTRKALWVDHLFEPFLDWVNETLNQMEWLSLSQTDCGGVRWAELHKERHVSEDPFQEWIPLRRDQSKVI